MGQKAARKSLDSVDSHTKGDITHAPNVFVEGSLNVFINNENVVRVGDKSECGEEAIEGSSTVFVNQKALHRKDDATLGHDGFSQTITISGSDNVIVG